METVHGTAAVRPLAPGLVRMAWGCALMVVAMLVPDLLAFGGGLAGYQTGIVLLALLCVGVVLAHAGYRQARLSLGADPTLRGAFFVRHAWWLVIVAIVVLGLLKLPLMLYLAPGAR